MLAVTRLDTIFRLADSERELAGRGRKLAVGGWHKARTA
jgi:hypothetical protein